MCSEWGRHTPRLRLEWGLDVRLLILSSLWFLPSAFQVLNPGGSVEEETEARKLEMSGGAHPLSGGLC